FYSQHCPITDSTCWPVNKCVALGASLPSLFRARPDAERFINGAQFVRPVTSFGGTHTSAERRARWGDQVPAGFVRLSVGCEPIDVLWAEIKRVLDTL